MSESFEGSASDGWIPMPPGWTFTFTKVVMRNAQSSTLTWFPIPDPNGYVGIGLALMSKTGPACEFWIWTDDSADRTARVVRLGYRRYVVELHGEDVFAVVEDPTGDACEQITTTEEREVLGRTAVSLAQTFSSSVAVESCVRLWLNHGRLHDGFSPRHQVGL